MTDNPAKDPRKMVNGQTIDDIDDPWIEAYLRMRQAMLDREISTIADAQDWAATARRALPREGPSVTAAMFITADIAISFPEGDTSSDADLMTALWIPR
ncbi:MAG: hypothetical protein ACRDS0_10520 [Pseudonocardiaceae bacterium]